MADHLLDPPDDRGSIASALLRAGFRADVDDTGGCVVVRLQGELDMATAPGLSRVLNHSLDAKPSALTLDLSDLTFVDSTGIGVLITACRRAGAQGCAFSVRSPQRAVLRALRLTGVDRVLAVAAGPADY